VVIDTIHFFIELVPLSMSIITDLNALIPTDSTLHLLNADVVQRN
jgi:hypothetical protein